MEYFASQDPRSYSLYFDLNIWFRARKVTGTFEKRAPGQKTGVENYTFWSEIGPGFGEPGGTPPPRIPSSIPPPGGNSRWVIATSNQQLAL